MRFTIQAYRVGVPPLWHISSGRDASFVELRRRSSSDAFRIRFTLHPTAQAVAAGSLTSSSLPWKSWRSTLLAAVALSIMFGAVFGAVIDLDQPQAGTIRVDLTALAADKDIFAGTK